MPKMKSHSASKKRFSVTSNGHVKRYKTGKRHILTKKSSKRKRSLRQGAYLDPVRENTVKKMILTK